MNCEFCDKKAIVNVRQYAHTVGGKLLKTNTEIVVAHNGRKLRENFKFLIEPNKLDGKMGEITKKEGFTAYCFNHYKEKVK